VEIPTVEDVGFGELDDTHLADKLKSTLAINDKDSAWQIVHEMERRRG
jgi:hypothetical protein